MGNYIYSCIHCNCAMKYIRLLPAQSLLAELHINGLYIGVQMRSDYLDFKRYSVLCTT